MTIKSILKEAIAAHIQGDTQKFNELMKQAATQKVRSMISESAIADATVFLEDVEFNGDQYGADLGIAVTHYAPATRGTYSSRASDPSEYYGDDEELEWEVVSVTLTDEDGNKTVLNPAQVKEFASSLTPEESEYIERSLISQREEGLRDDELERYDRSTYDYY